jgi:hypothetical protein
MPKKESGKEKEEIYNPGYTLGIVSIIMAIVSPVAGIIFGIVGLIYSKKSIYPKAKVSRTLNIIGIILGLFLFIISIILGIATLSQGGMFPN